MDQRDHRALVAWSGHLERMNAARMSQQHRVRRKVSGVWASGCVPAIRDNKMNSASRFIFLEANPAQAQLSSRSARKCGRRNGCMQAARRRNRENPFLSACGRTLSSDYRVNNDMMHHFTDKDKYCLFEVHVDTWTREYVETFLIQ